MDHLALRKKRKLFFRFKHTHTHTQEDYNQAEGKNNKKKRQIKNKITFFRLCISPQHFHILLLPHFLHVQVHLKELWMDYFI